MVYRRPICIPVTGSACIFQENGDGPCPLMKPSCLGQQSGFFIMRSGWRRVLGVGAGSIPQYTRGRMTIPGTGFDLGGNDRPGGCSGSAG